MTQRILATVTLLAIISLMSAGCTEIVTRQWSGTLEAEAHKQSVGQVSAVVSREREVFKFNDNGGRGDNPPYRGGKGDTFVTPGREISSLGMMAESLTVTTSTAGPFSRVYP